MRIPLSWGEAWERESELVNLHSALHLLYYGLGHLVDAQQVLIAGEPHLLPMLAKIRVYIIIRFFL